MNKRARSDPTLGLELKLSPPPRVATSLLYADLSSESSTSLSSTSVHSLEGSCVSSEAKAEETKAMLLVGCPRCLMYVMVPEVDPKCPKCKSTVLLDFLNNIENTTKKTSS